MHIEHLSLRNFRNIKELDLELGEQSFAVLGNNGQGKTNLLEALFLAATGKSFRQAPAKEWIRFGQQALKIRGRFLRHGVRHDIEVKVENGRRSISLDGRRLKRRVDLLRLVNVIAFFPDDLRMIKGGPDERRRFFDRALANHDEIFVDTTLRYRKVLKSRNALLRKEGRIDATLLDIHDEQLSKMGAAIAHARIEMLRTILPMAQKLFSRMLDGIPLTAQWHWSASLSTNTENEAALEASFLEGLKLRRTVDIRRRSTSVGPHRADVHIFFDGQPARQFASQGQQRSMVLAFKLAELEWLSSHLGTPPILLLDDVSSELDEIRSRHFFEHLQSHAHQIWLSSTGIATLPLGHEFRSYEMRGGVLRPEAGSF